MLGLKLIHVSKMGPGAYLRFKSPVNFLHVYSITICCKSYPNPLSDLIKLQYLDTAVS